MHAASRVQMIFAWEIYYDGSLSQLAYYVLPPYARDNRINYQTLFSSNFKHVTPRRDTLGLFGIKHDFGFCLEVFGFGRILFII